jgi:hypothetical protein
MLLVKRYACGNETSCAYWLNLLLQIVINSTVWCNDFRYDKKLGFRMGNVNGIIVHCITYYENEAVRSKKEWRGDQRSQFSSCVVYIVSATLLTATFV